MLHQPMLPLELFQKWGLDFVNPFTPAAARTGNRYILVAPDCYTKWVEAKLLRDNSTASKAKFLYVTRTREASQSETTDSEIQIPNRSQIGEDQ